MSRVKDAMMNTEEIMIKALNNWTSALLADDFNDREISIDRDNFDFFYDNFMRVEDADSINDVWHNKKYTDALNIIEEIFEDDDLRAFYEDFFIAYNKKLDEIEEILRIEY